MPDVLMYADTYRSPELRHEVPIGIPDPFLYAEKDGAKHIAIGAMEVPRLAELGLFELHPSEEYGADELIQSGLSYPEVRQQVVLRAVKKLGITSAVVPETFPVWLADRLRADGVELRADHELFERRRRVKSAAELAGIRRAQAAAEAGIAAGAALLRAAEIAGDELRRDGEPLLAETVRAAIRDACAARGAAAPPDIIVARSDRFPGGHDPGHGPLAPGVPITVDLWPRDEESGCWADMTRTFVVGEPNAATAEMHRLSMEALERAVAAIKPGVTGVAVFDIACDVFEAAGHPTQRTKTPGEPLSEGFFFALGHGVGLEVHEAPMLGRTGHDPLVAGDVLAIEPGTSRGGDSARVEDLVLVTDDGAEVLTDYPYHMTP
jgi:Xaa-Pro aminopeptidase